ncbi:glycoside hydrolase family 31 protein [Streptomyces litchfieldiae]|uniref:Glycoside hydrolase family 31 protein n=1 Tax=Streptomyces litchfieldiae TaxID=3075543 RepID=A0ABU2MXN5_9ACTN|nr:TIM-barrel domain-containing protein [Streptomyces sp. DSM 44938]MDT0346380.1 glycoside hydrolase family 31 protein [Streptomyces sp. DSM 44938]
MATETGTETDAYVAADPEPDGAHLRVTLASGRTLRLACTVPVEGVLRLRQEGTRGTPEYGSPIVSDLPDHPARVTRVPEGAEISGPGVHAVWQGGQGLRFGAYRRFADPEADTVPFRAGYCPPSPGHPAGRWIETIQLAPDAAVYGGGESYQGIDLRGRHRTLRNTEESRAAGRDSAYLNVPLLWSDAGWGLYAHTGATVEADLGATHSEAAAVEMGGEHLDLFLIAGDGPGILRRYQALTGRPRALPPWAFGVWMGRCSYFTADEVVRTVDELRAADCPVDVVHVDEWLAESVLDSASWSAGADRSRFPAGWSRALEERGVRTSLWINPYVKRGTPIGDELTARGYLIRDPAGEPAATADNPDTLVLDFTNPEARAWWSARLTRTLREERNAAVLADFGEEIPEEAVFADGTRGTERHNSYGLIYQDAVRETGLLARDGDFVSISRSGTAGSQRDPAHWAGDLPSTWGGMVSTLRALLSLALSGVSLVTHDAGGYWTPDSYRFAEEIRATMTPDALPADVEPELYGRWAQWAAFTPLMRFHGVGRREPTAYPEPARGAAIAACRLRHRLRAYTAEAAAEPLPLMRPMPLAYPGDRAARDAGLQYLFGPDVLVAPVLEPGGRRVLYVPPGEWSPLLGCPPVSGPGWRELHCGPAEFPAFVRAERGPGAVLRD